MNEQLPIRYRNICTLKIKRTESSTRGIHHKTKAEQIPETTHIAYVPLVACVSSFVVTFFFLQCGHSGSVTGNVRPGVTPDKATAISSGVAVLDCVSRVVFVAAVSAMVELENDGDGDRILPL